MTIAIFSLYFFIGGAIARQFALDWAKGEPMLSIFAGALWPIFCVVYVITYKEQPR